MPDIEVNSEEKSSDSLPQRLAILHLAFPDHKMSPASRFQGGQIVQVALHIAVPFGFPEVCIRLRPDLSISTIMHVPETAMNEDDLAAALENQVWGARQSPIMETVPIAH